MDGHERDPIKAKPNKGYLQSLSSIPGNRWTNRQFGAIGLNGQITEIHTGEPPEGNVVELIPKVEPDDICA